MTDKQLKDAAAVTTSVIFFIARLMDEEGYDTGRGYMNMPGFSKRTFGWFDLVLDVFVYMDIRNGHYTEQESWTVRKYAYDEYRLRWIIWKRGH